MPPLRSIVLLLAAVGAAGQAHAGACPDPRDLAVLRLPGDGLVVAAGAAVRVAVGLDHLGRGGWPDCRAPRTPRAAHLTLAEAGAPTGPWATVAEGNDRTLAWRPTHPGVRWLRLTARDQAGATQATIQAAVVATGEVAVRGAAPGSPVRALLIAAASPEGAGALARVAGPDGVIRLPRAAASWRLERRGGPAWARIAADGAVTVTPADAVARLALDPILDRGWTITPAVPGVPPLTTWCNGECTVAGLPPGPVALRLRPAPAAATAAAAARPPRRPPQTVTVTAARGRPPRRVLSPLHLLAGRPQPATWPAPLGAAPALAAAGGSCAHAVPFDGPDGPAALGTALCRPAAGGGWAPRLNPPPALVRGAPTRPAHDDTRVVWAETEAAAPRRVVGFVGRAGGVVAETIAPLAGAGACRAAAVVVAGDATLAAAGACRDLGAGASRGFVAHRDATGWRVAFLPEPVVALAAAGPEVVAAAGRDLLRCRAGHATLRCVRVARAAAPVVGLVHRDARLLVVQRDGATFHLDRRGLHPAHPAAALDLTISRLAAGPAGVVALFGPVVVGSEYHPFCVRSVVARLGPGGWEPLHRVEGDRGRRLACQDDDAHPVVVDLALAGRQVYARRRGRYRDVDPGFAPLVVLR